MRGVLTLMSSTRCIAKGFFIFCLNEESFLTTIHMATPAMMAGRLPVSSSDFIIFSATSRHIYIMLAGISSLGAASSINFEGGIVVFYSGRRGKIYRERLLIFFTFCPV